MARPKPRLVKGFRDVFAPDLLARGRMVEAVRRVYERYGFLPLDTPAVEYVDVLGKFLPESATPEGGIFAFRNPDLGESAAPTAPDYWLGMRYDLTAPLARVVAQYQELAKPFRRYQLGTVWRYEKPGPGRFREFTQFDFDSVGVASVAADAETCMVICDALESLGFARGEYSVRVNDRKVVQGVLECAGLDPALESDDAQAAVAMRAMDKYDRLGAAGVAELLGQGRRDESGDFTPGARLTAEQTRSILAYLEAKTPERGGVLAVLEREIGASAIGREGLDELRQMDALLARLGYGDDRVAFDPAVIRGLSYYTGPVFEGVLTRELVDEQGQARQFGSVFGGGRYDNLVERFTGQKVPATGASVGLDRLLEALKLLKPAGVETTAAVLVTTMDRERLPDYLALGQALRAAGINAEVYLGTGGIGRQLKYADALGIPLALIAGSDEFARGEWQLKDLRLGRELAGTIESRDEWRKGQPAQQTVPAADVVARVKELLGRS